MNILLWLLQILAAAIYAASGVMKLFMFEKISHDVPSFGALPKNVWQILGAIELVCVLGLLAPGAFHLNGTATVYAAAILAVEAFVFIMVHAKYREFAAVAMSAALGAAMAFVAYGRALLSHFE